MMKRAFKSMASPQKRIQILQLNRLLMLLRVPRGLWKDHYFQVKKLLLLTVCSLLCTILKAQPWMPTGNPGPVKFSDIVAAYPKHSGKDDNEDQAKHGKVQKEGENYLFDRWAWYWRQHLDSNGYIVPPTKTLTEWQKYVDNVRQNKVTSRTMSLPSNWLFQGPNQSAGGYAGLGRINVVAFDPVDSNTFYIGSAAGSTWKTTDGGNTWASLYDNLPTLGVSDIKINPRNRNTIYVATGDGDGGDAYSSGVIKSYDGGNTWLTTGLNWLPTNYYNAYSLVINPVDTNTMILSSSNGIYLSHDAGNSWIRSYGSAVKQILYNPGDTNTLYGTTAGGSCQMILSKDGGNTWHTVTSLSGAQRINIAVSPANSSIVMALATNSNSGLLGVYMSSDTGVTYAPVSTDASCTNNLLGYDIGLPTSNCNGQGWYDLCIAMDPANPSNVIVGGINTYYSSDGGNTWTLTNQWYNTVFNAPQTVHADKHCLAYNPLTGAAYESCDGGIYKSYAPLAGEWKDLTNGIGITEFYKNAVDNAVPFCIGGAQDNGTKMVNGGVATDLTGGDGMQCRIDYTDPTNTFYSGYPNGSFDVTFDGGTSYGSITNTLTGSGDWVTPFIIHPSNPGTLLLGYDTLWVSYNYGASWSGISPRFSGSNNINTIVIPFTNNDYIYVVVDNNVIHYTTNFGATWSSITKPVTGTISDLAVDPKNEKQFWITMNGYGTEKVLGYNLTTNTWTHETGSLPDIPVNCMVIDSSSSTRYIGTDAAVFYKDTTMTDWVLFDNNLPSVRVSDLNINYTTNQIWAATFGRGMWMSPKADLTSTGLPVVPATAAAISVFPDPNHGIFTISTTYKEFKGQSVTIKLVSSDGKAAWQEDAAFDNSGNLKVNATGLMKGVYICVVSNKNMVSYSG